MFRRLLMLSSLLLSLLLASVASAQTLSELTYKRLSKIHELMGEEKYSDALQRLDKLQDSVKRNDYEHAMVLQTYGYIWAQRGNYSKAASYFRKAIDLKALPELTCKYPCFTLVIAGGIFVVATRSGQFIL